MSTTKFSSSSLSQINFQGRVDSAPLQNNFTAIKNKINELIDDVASAITGSSPDEVANARPYHATLLDRLDSILRGNVPRVKYGMEVSYNSMDETIEITPGEANVDGRDITAPDYVISYDSNFTSGAGKVRFDCVVVNSDGFTDIISGTELFDTDDRFYPDIDNTQRVLAVILVTDTTKTVYDAREQGCIYYINGIANYAFDVQQSFDEIIASADYETGWHSVNIFRGTYFGTYYPPSNTIVNCNLNSIFIHPSSQPVLSIIVPTTTDLTAGVHNLVWNYGVLSDVYVYRITGLPGSSYIVFNNIHVTNQLTNSSANHLTVNNSYITKYSVGCNTPTQNFYSRIDAINEPTIVLNSITALSNKHYYRSESKMNYEVI